MGEGKSERPTLENILQTLRRHLPQLRERYGVKSLWVFGSYVRGEQERNSDLDILVEFEKAPSLFQFIRLEDELRNLLGVEVDLVMKSALKPRIGERILSEVVPV
jgi:hypothetical protein